MYNEIRVEVTSPPAIAWPRGAYNSLPTPVAIAIGRTPNIVDRVVIKIGLNLEPEPLSTIVLKFSIVSFVCLLCKLKLSINIIPLFTTKPERARNPNILIKLMEEPKNNKLNTTPIIQKGIVAITIIGCLKFSNWKTITVNTKKIAIKMAVTIGLIASVINSNKPPGLLLTPSANGFSFKYLFM